MSLSGADAWDLNFGPHLPSDKQAPILDIGCGYGEFLEHLETKGYRNLRGVEIDATRAEASRQRTRAAIDHAADLDLYLGGLNDRFALITLKSVIAHFPHDKAVPYLRAMRGMLASDGKLIVETFNASRWTGPYVLFNDFTHRWAYTEYSLQQVLEAAGLRVVKLGGELMPAHHLSTRLFHLAQRVWMRMVSVAFLVERGVGRNPTILSKYLVAVCERDA